MDTCHDPSFASNIAPGYLCISNARSQNGQRATLTKDRSMDCYYRHKEIIGRKPRPETSIIQSLYEDGMTVNGIAIKLNLKPTQVEGVIKRLANADIIERRPRAPSKSK